jgi:hypothetical protein
MDTDFIQKAIQNTLDHPANNLSSTSKDLLETCINQLKVNSETRVYVIDTEDERVEDVYWEELTDEEFMFEAEEQGRVYTLDGFAKAFNLEEINSSTDAIRFIQVPVYV